MNMPSFVITPPKLPTPEEIAEAEALYQTTDEGIALKEVLDLRDWIARAEKAGIAHVPVFPVDIEPLSLEELFGMMDDPKSPEIIQRREELDRKTQEKLGEIDCKYTPPSMWRWNTCAPLEIKERMAEMLPCSENQTPPSENYDPRHISISESASRAGVKDIIPLVRPWLNVMKVLEYPVEFRVHVNAEGKTVTTSYYPQRDLGPEWAPAAENATRLALKLRPFVKAGVPYSADFVVLEEADEVVFLEGGPHFKHGGHPCCINPATFTEENQIVLTPEWDYNSQG